MKDLSVGFSPELRHLHEVDAAVKNARNAACAIRVVFRQQPSGSHPLHASPRAAVDND